MLRWFKAILARLARRGPSGPPPRLGWNGRPRVEATEGRLSPGQRNPDADYCTFVVFGSPGGPEPPGAPQRPAE
jgi:hypothetical protein